MSMKTLVLGASPTPVRHSYKAVKRLLSYGYEVVAIGKIEGQIETVNINTQMIALMHVGSSLQPRLDSRAVFQLLPQ